MSFLFQTTNSVQYYNETINPYKFQRVREIQTDTCLNRIHRQKRRVQWIRGIQKVGTNSQNHSIVQKYRLTKPQGNRGPLALVKGPNLLQMELKAESLWMKQ
ncbi:hypothetical protein FGO68_gene14656 [Halteria grandinella]|uniref:Uncharacterized protein n=1 Tax=Halteria grandinella TaxID=5974 RepID=A0A8J8NH13_HALGN|nr:hypothetical protein FGO68_gene14656 [Halteria grandinella]